jgi:bacterioferritin (cytochrome b1)
MRQHGMWRWIKGFAVQEMKHNKMTGQRIFYPKDSPMIKLTPINTGKKRKDMIARNVNDEEEQHDIFLMLLEEV